MSILEKVKEHPALTVAAIVGVLVIVYVINHSGGSSAASAPGPGGGDVAAATAYQQSLLAASSQANQASTALAANKDNIAGQIQLATIQAQQSGAHDALAAQVATSQISASEQVQSLLGSLSAEVAKGAQQTDLGKTTVLATNQTQQQQILANALVAQSQTQAQVSQAGFAAQTEIASHRGGLFGGGGFLGLGF